MTTVILTILAIISAVIHMWAEYNGPPVLISIFKPLTMLFIITIAVLAKSPPSRKYKVAIIAGLIFSLSGDIFLILPVDLFIAGLISFLIAHLFYIFAFRSGRPWRFNVVVMLILAIYGMLMYALLLPGLGGLALPVAGYVLVILTMIWQAYDQWDQLRGRWALFAIIGALFFAASDTFLALNKFWQPFAAEKALTLSTYFIAQWLIANSNYT